MTESAVYFSNHARRARFPWSLYHRGIDARIASALVMLPRKPSVLVVGCGLDLDLPVRSDAAFYGSDLDARAIEACARARPELASRLGVCPSPYQQPNFGVAFDAIVAKEVVEHVEDPGRWARALSALLAPRGVLVLSTPNYGAGSTLPLLERTVLEWIARRDGYSRAHIHPSKFDRDKLAMLDAGPLTRLVRVEVTWSRWALIGIWQRT